MADKKTYYATRTFSWEGKSIDIGDAVELGPLDAKWMLARQAVTEDKPTAVKTAPKATKAAGNKK